ncbi:MAG: tetratricopeptide repeat protein [Spirochaetales bacterium]|nr:tetratricopeptide repeat protein [Spirochaetales bacterium]MCF7937558.1 tetratricopeptide repeat protein [Spirochaetales bacterium]
MKNLENIIYISVPEDLQQTIEGFTIDPSILLPVELPPGKTTADLGALSWEMIISAMLRILAWDEDHEDASYYRSFIMTVKPDIIQELTEAAIFKAKNGDQELAEEMFRALKNLQPEDPRSRLNLAMLFEQRAETYRAAGNQEKAEEYDTQALNTYRHGLVIDPSFADLHLNIAFFYLKNHNTENAKSHLETFLRLSDDQDKISQAESTLQKLNNREQMDRLFQEAYDFIQMGKEDEGIRRIEEFLQANPSIWNAWFLLGWGNRRIGNYQEAKQAFLKSLELESQQVDTLNELSICLIELQEYQEARRRLEQALRFEPENTKIISNLGILSLKLGEKDEAEGFFTTVLELDPEDSIARQYLEQMDEENNGKL